MPNGKPQDELVERLRELIKGIGVAMLTTMQDGRLHSRPLATRHVDFDGDLRFLTAKSSHKVSELRRNSVVNVSYADPEDGRYVSISGRVELVDRKKAKELWCAAHRAWFPKGVDDPDLVVLRVRVDQAQYWGQPLSRMVTILAVAKAIVTGNPMKGRESNVIHI